VRNGATSCNSDSCETPRSRVRAAANSSFLAERRAYSGPHKTIPTMGITRPEAGVPR